MSKYNKGDKVINASTQEKGIIIEAYPPRRGRQLYKVRYLDRENDEMSATLLPDIDLTDPFERCRQNYYDHYTEFLKDNTSFKISSSNNSTISSLKASKTLFKPYQFKPLMKFLNSGNKRILIADEVGLGKTIEAGHIMLELKARGELQNALVICPKALRTKWATELSDKFGLDFMEINDSEQLLQELQHHNGNVRAVVNYDRVRDVYEKEVEEAVEDADTENMQDDYFDEWTDDLPAKSKNKRLRKRLPNKIISYIQEKNISFSIIICDESHKLRNDNTLVYKGTERLLLQSDSVVFMSATPIMIDETNLYNQLHLLDSNTYDNEEIFLNNLQLNRPFVHAITQLKYAKDLKSIGRELAETEVTTQNTINERTNTYSFKVDEYFKEYPIYQHVMDNLMNAEDNAEVRASINRDLAEMSPMSHIFSRTRKREVTQDWSQTERCPHTIEVQLTPEEQQAYAQSIKEYKEEYIRKHGIKAKADRKRKNSRYSLGMVSLRRQLASSVWAERSNINQLDAGYDKFYKYKDAKFEELMKILQTVFEHGNKKIIIFAVFKKTLKYLRIRLEAAGYKCAILYGDPAIQKNEVLAQFQNDENIQVLLSSEVGSEGLDMQFCHSMVNYDLPWNPMVVEQRIGRIDRFGQASPKVNIYSLVVTGSILEKIYYRLLERIGIFRDSIGDLEVILDSVFEGKDGQKVTIHQALADIEQDFYSENLTEDEVQRKADEIEQAVANENNTLHRIEEGLTNCLTNDAYFKDEINKIVHNNAYVTANELYLFLVQMIKEYLTTCEIKATDDAQIFDIIIPKSDPKCIRKFLQRYEPVDVERMRLFRRYEDEIEDKSALRVTFEQERAFKDKQLDYINIYHPLIQAGVKMFEEKKSNAQCTFTFELRKENLPEGIKEGRYMLAVYKIAASRLIFGKKVTSESLYPILYNIEENKIISEHDLAEKFMGRTAVDGQYAPLDNDFRLGNEVVDDLRYDLKESIDQYVDEYRHTLQLSIENNKMIRYQQTVQYYNIREKNFQDVIKETESELESASFAGDSSLVDKLGRTLRLHNANLRDLSKRKEADLEKINNDVQLKVTEEIKSLNLIKVV
jgi:SNF2 family DNA or RNA helicase